MHEGRARTHCWLLVLVLATGCDSSDDEPKAKSAAQPQPQSEATESTFSDTPPKSDPWAELGEQELKQRIDAARASARKDDKHVLLEFVAPWCSDCREVVRTAEQEPAASVIAERYERVFVNVGRFDRHEELLSRYGVDRIATLVVLDGNGEQLARTTLEPISKGQGLEPEALAAWLRAPDDTGGPAARPQ